MQQVPTAAARGSTTQTMMERCAEALLEHIRAAFLTKSRGGTDDAGDRWAPLAPKTVAYSRRGQRIARESGRGSRPSQALSERQRTRWWDLYRQGLAIFQGEKAAAARRAWAILKREGATTFFDKYGSRRVTILYDTGALYRSIKARVNRSEAVVSSDHPGAAAHHNGVPGKLPQRRLWPGPYRWPVSWWEDIIQIVQQEVADIAERAARGV